MLTWLISASGSASASRYSRQASVVITNPGGTLMPIWVISHRLAPLPPSSFLSWPSPSANENTSCLVMDQASVLIGWANFCSTNFASTPQPAGYWGKPLAPPSTDRIVDGWHSVRTNGRGTIGITMGSRAAVAGSRYVLVPRLRAKKACRSRRETANQKGLPWRGARRGFRVSMSGRRQLIILRFCPCRPHQRRTIPMDYRLPDCASAFISSLA